MDLLDIEFEIELPSALWGGVDAFRIAQSDSELDEFQSIHIISYALILIKDGVNV